MGFFDWLLHKNKNKEEPVTTESTTKPSHRSWRYRKDGVTKYYI